MYDMHYDLLTILYVYLKKEKHFFYSQEKLVESVQKIYHNNIIGGIINLYFMAREEMLRELGITKEELQDVKVMFQKSIEYLKKFQENNLISKEMEFLYSIEGCDYLEDENDLEPLYEMGLDAILPVWNEKNKFGSGNRSSDGLTKMGERLIKKAIQLGIIIDVSHANKQTFYDILDIVEKEQRNGAEVMVVASHSNVRALCDRDRNLDDDQLGRLKEVGGYLGLFTNSKFLVSSYQELSYEDRQQAFLNHLHYVIDKIDFPIFQLIVSTDDMNFHPDSSYHHREAFFLDKIAVDLRKKIKESFNDDVAQAILMDNPKKIINWSRRKREVYNSKGDSK